MKIKRKDLKDLLIGKLTMEQHEIKEMVEVAVEVNKELTQVIREVYSLACIKFQREDKIETANEIMNEIAEKLKPYTEEE